MHIRESWKKLKKILAVRGRGVLLQTIKNAELGKKRNKKKNPTVTRVTPPRSRKKKTKRYSQPGVRRGRQ